MEKLRSKGQRDENARLRKMREDLGYTQEQFSQILGINISTYKKIETYNRRISLDNLMTLHEKLNVSVDYILFGDRTPQEQAWTEMLNCTETDKVILFLRLFRYFTQNKPEIFPEDDGASLSLEDVIRMLTGEREAKERGEA